MRTPRLTCAAVAILAGLALALGAGACGGSSSTHHSRAASTPAATKPVGSTASASAATASSQQDAHALATPAAAVRRYALLYGNLCSCSRAVATLNELAMLATPALASQLRRAALSARAAVARGLPEPAQAVGTIASVELAPAHGSTQTGLVVLAERTTIPRQGTTAPTPVAYTARLALTSDGWRVASFQPVPPSH